MQLGYNCVKDGRDCFWSSQCRECKMRQAEHWWETGLAIPVAHHKRQHLVRWYEDLGARIARVISNIFISVSVKSYRIHFRHFSIIILYTWRISVICNKSQHNLAITLCKAIYWRIWFGRCFISPASQCGPNPQTLVSALFPVHSGWLMPLPTHVLWRFSVPKQFLLQAVSSSQSRQSGIK